MAGRGRPKGSHDIAPMIRGAFIRAVKGLEDDGKPLSSLIREQLENNPLATLKAMAAFNPKESNVTQREITDVTQLTDAELIARILPEEEIIERIAKLKD